MIYGIFFGWACYALLEGWREAYYFHFKGQVNGTKDEGEHTLFFIQRAFVALLCLGMYYILEASYLQIGLFWAAYALSFPFLHDGSYYAGRNKIDNSVYPLKFRDHSSTSTAILTKFFPWPVRLITFIISVALLVVTTLFIK